MRFRILLPLVTLATAVFARPQPNNGARVQADVRGADSVAGSFYLEKRDEHRDLERGLPILPRSLGDLGAGAFAGSGATSSRIKALQHLLHDHGYDVTSDGVWGPETQSAVTAFQSGKGLAADGVPGFATLGALLKEVSQGSLGNVVKAAQTLLNVDVDGDFGPGTKAAAVAYQTANGLEADGIVGKNTWTKLFGGGGGGGVGDTGGGDTGGGDTGGGDTGGSDTGGGDTGGGDTGGGDTGGGGGIGGGDGDIAVGDSTTTPTPPTPKPTGGGGGGVPVTLAPDGRCRAGQQIKQNSVTVTINGCGPQQGLDLIPEGSFGACCNGHDRCYGDCTKTKTACDSQFLSCLKDVCRRGGNKGGCLAAAAAYYAGVSAGGGSAYDNATKKYCICIDGLLR